MSMTVIDKTAKTWFVNTAAFRMPHPTRPEVIFEPGIKYLIDQDEWMKGQPTIIPTDMSEDVEDKVLKPEQPQGPKIEKPAGTK